MMCRCCRRRLSSATMRMALPTSDCRWTLEQDLFVADDGRLPWSLSISHSHGVALCAVVVNRKECTYVVGADLEYIEARDESFVRDYFTPAEMALVRQASPRQHEHTVTAIWSAKEAALKALRTGLRMDTRQVQCLIQPPLPLTEEWIAFELRLPIEETIGHIWSGWWRRMAQYPDFVMTIALRTQTDPG